MEEISKIAVAGAGTMGSGIALIFALKGYEVAVTDVAEKDLENAKRIISINQSSLIEEIAKEYTIMATNTSGLSITAISKKVVKKDRFIGMHWWNPPHIIPLIEITRALV